MAKHKHIESADGMVEDGIFASEQELAAFLRFQIRFRDWEVNYGCYAAGLWQARFTCRKDEATIVLEQIILRD